MRSPEQLPRARNMAETAGLPFRTATTSRRDEDKALVGIMHLAKGLEFRAVAVVAYDENVLPLAARVADVADAFELDEVFATERRPLNVAATRARDRLLVPGIMPDSELFESLSQRGQDGNRVIEAA